MAKETVHYKRTVKGSVGAGIGALFNGSGRQYYILEHKNSSQYHNAGESQKIIIDQVELGRDTNCQVRFDDSFETVSRRHAAIVKDGNGWKLVHLSNSNPTYLNGKRMDVANQEWFLQNGDEIQLSTNGPKLGFIVPAGKQSLVSSIKLTERLNLFRQQALRPYKQALVTLSVLFIVCVSGLTAFNVREHNARLDSERKAAAVADSLCHSQVELRERQKKDSVALAELDEKNKILATENKKLSNAVNNMAVISGIANEDKLNRAINSVYYVRVEKVDIILNDGSRQTISREDKDYKELFCVGTGFLLNDGRFVTARHVIDIHYFISSLAEKKKILLNMIETNGAGNVVITFGAYSPTHSFSFTNHDCIIDRSKDEIGEVAEIGRFAIAMAGDTDWACIHTSFKGNLVANNEAANSLKRQTRLIVLGYPSGYYTENVKAIQGSCIVASDKLDEGRILITERNFEHGNSGGPVFKVVEDGNIEVVGIISSGYGDTVGFIVPISQVK